MLAADPKLDTCSPVTISFCEFTAVERCTATTPNALVTHYPKLIKGRELGCGDVVSGRGAS